MAADLTYGQSHSIFSVPAGSTADVEGTGNRVTLAADIRLTVDGDSNEIAAASDSTLLIDPGAVGTVIDTNGASTTLFRGNDPSSGASAVIGTGRGTIQIAGQAGDVGPITVSVPEGAVSLSIETYGDGNLQGVYDITRAYSSAGGKGTLLGTVIDTTTNTSYSVVPANGAFGIYRQLFHYDRFQGLGHLIDTISDYVAPVPGGYAARSVVEYVAGNPFLASGMSSETDRYAGPDLTGGLVTSTVDFTDGRSGVFTPGKGAFGVYQTVDYYTGADAGGVLYQHSINYVAVAAVGQLVAKSISDFTGNGRYGIFRTELHSDAPSGGAPVTRTTLDVVDGRSITITPGATAASSETETVTSGLDGSGRVLSSTTVAAGTDATLFDAFSANARFPSVSSEIANASVRPADFHAAVSPASMHSVSVAASALGSERIGAAVAQFVDPMRHMAIVGVRPG